MTSSTGSSAANISGAASVSILFEFRVYCIHLAGITLHKWAGIRLGKGDAQTLAESLSKASIQRILRTRLLIIVSEIAYTAFHVTVMFRTNAQ